MPIKTRIALVAVLVVASMTASARDYNVTDFGAKADGTTLNTNIIQHAIDYVSAQGGGTVVFTPGRYLTGTIYIKSGVTLELQNGSELLGSTNPWDYDKNPIVNWQSLIFAIRQHDIGIKGQGTINGQGAQTANNKVDIINRGLYDDPLRNGRPYEGNRPMNIYFRECENIRIEGITLRDPASWNQTYDQCRNLLVDGITVDSKAYWNNDGIDVVDCDGVVICNANIDAADDVFCFKSHSADHVCQNVVVENCVGRSSANGLKFGTVSRGGFRNFKVRNLTIYNTYRSAITFATVDGGVIDSIEVDGLRSIHTGNVIFLRAGRRWNNGKEPSMSNIVIRNVYAEIPASKPDAGYSYEGPVEDMPRNISPASIVGIPTCKIRNVTLQNIEIVTPGGGNPLYAYRGTTPAELNSVPEMEKAYPEFSQFKELPAWGFYIRHAENITFDNVTFRALRKDYRPAIVADDVKGLALHDVHVDEPGSQGKQETVLYHSTRK